MLSVDEKRSSAASTLNDPLSTGSSLESLVYILYTPDRLSKPEDLQIPLPARPEKAVAVSGAELAPLTQGDFFLATSSFFAAAQLPETPGSLDAPFLGSARKWISSNESAEKGEPRIKILTAVGLFDLTIANRLLNPATAAKRFRRSSRSTTSDTLRDSAVPDMRITQGGWLRNDAAYVIDYKSSNTQPDPLCPADGGLARVPPGRSQFAQRRFIESLQDFRPIVGLYGQADVTRALTLGKTRPRQNSQQRAGSSHVRKPANRFVVFGECDKRPVAYSFPRDFTAFSAAQFIEHAGRALFSHGTPLLEPDAAERLLAVHANASERTKPAIPVERVRAKFPQPAQPILTRPPLFLIHDLLTDAHLYQPLEYQLASERSVFRVQPTPDLTKGPHPISFGALAQECVLDILDQQKEGPFHLTGFSSGSLIAFEMARQLQERGYEVGLLALIDGSIKVPGSPALKPAEFPKVAIQKLCKVAFTFRDHASAPTRFVAERLRYLSLVRKAKQLKFTAANETELTMEQTLWLAQSAYYPQPYKGSALLVRFHDEAWMYGPDPLMGWGAVVRGGIDVLDLPGGHLSGISGARVPPLVDILRRKIEEAEAASVRKRRSAALRAATLSQPYAVAGN
jgi:thioesterase domain-containing protein